MFLISAGVDTLYAMMAEPKRRDFPQDAALTPSELESKRAAKIARVVDAKRLASKLGAAGNVYWRLEARAIPISLLVRHR
ncbi:hypothetical protein BWU74_12465 [Paraburkholderia caledonica]|nr:hypothetical protein BWU74_12465 [Burkholderia sp. Bk]